YVKECSRLMDIAETVLLRKINELRRQELQNRNSEGQNVVTHKEDNPQVHTEETPTAQEEKVDSPESSNSTKQEWDSPSSAANDRAERTLIRYIIRYGNVELFSPKEGDDVCRVAPYILEDLHSDEIKFSNPLYQKICDETESLITHEGFDLARHFTSHPNSEISDIALDCLSDKYELSKIHTRFQQVLSEEERLSELVPRALLELKDAIIDKKIKQKQEELKLAKDNPEEVKKIMREIAKLYKLKTVFAKELGERTVRPF
ncbi:MAG: DNA primase, partial [Porphyromonadaceae bacterium]|nr:DNA primase [Porphyromonadaceae bacterium]